MLGDQRAVEQAICISCVVRIARIVGVVVMMMMMGAGMVVVMGRLLCRLRRSIPISPAGDLPMGGLCSVRNLRKVHILRVCQKLLQCLLCARRHPLLAGMVCRR